METGSLKTDLIKSMTHEPQTPAGLGRFSWAHESLPVIVFDSPSFQFFLMEIASI